MKTIIHWCGGFIVGSCVASTAAQHSPLFCVASGLAVLSFMSAWASGRLAER